MSYSEKFSSQWDMLIVKFKSYLQSSNIENITLKDIREWYRTYTFRWSSIVEKEGLMLKEQNNSELKRELISAISDFRFQEIKLLPKKPKSLPFLIVGLSVAILAVVLLKKFLHISIWIMILVALGCIFLPVFIYAGLLDKYITKKNKAIVEGYAQQLQEYKQKLSDICEK